MSIICGLGLVTRGYLCCGVTENQLVSCDRPEFVGVIEVRPKIRWVEGQQPPTTPVPSMTTAQELRPKMSGQAEPEPTSTSGPKQVSAQELRPKMVKVEEED